jgi:two-component system heavy metal sensor histidine kinase CusS
MIGASIRARLTAWYVAVLAVATLSLTGASWWLSSQSVVRAADISLEARVEGVRDFLENPRTRLTVEGLQDEFSEYAELTRGEALLEVIDAAGVVLVRPSVPGWAEMADGEARIANSSDVRPNDRPLGKLPFRVACARIEARGRMYRVTVAAPMGPAYAALNRFHRWLILLLPAVLALAGVGGYWVSRRALVPVDRMTRAVQVITVQSLDRRLEVPAANDELRRLASTFNDVLARLQSAVGDIVRFTADASHELRTPVSLVRTTAELALRHERTPREYRAALTDVVDHARNMSALVDDLLVLARTDAGIEPREAARLDLREVVSEAGREIAELAQLRSVSVCVDTPAEPLMVKGDRVSLRRLVLILLDNAVKYSPSGNKVHLRVSGERPASDGTGHAVIEVTDSGIGLDPTETPRIFERFYRGARARQHAPDGTGLGLAIAQTIVDRYQGSITLQPTRDPNNGNGCDVTVTLPLMPETPSDVVDLRDGGLLPETRAQTA